MASRVYQSDESTPSQAACFSNGQYVGFTKKKLHDGHIIASETEYTEGLASVWHYHENTHFSHILTGGSIEIGECNTQTQTQGDSMFYNPYMLHRNTRYKEGTRIFNLELEPGFYKKNKLDYSSANIFWTSSDAHFKKMMIVKSMSEFFIGDNHSSLSIEQLCVLLCQQSPVKSKLVKDRHWSSLLKEFMQENWNKPFTLSDLSDQVQIHPVTISRYFSKYFHCTLGEYARRIKVEKSFALIRNKRYSLTQIAYDCGFTDQSHFSKTFKDITGILPKEYRKL